MQDSDDYFANDDLVLDDTVIAALDEQESKFVESQRLTQQAQAHPNSPPPAKRQKLYHELPLRTASLDELQLPEVSLHGSQAYDIASRRRASGSNWNAAGRNVSARVESPNQHHAQYVTRHDASAANVQRSVPPRAAPNQPLLAPSRRASSSSVASNVHIAMLAPKTEDATLRAELEVLRAQLKELTEERGKKKQEYEGERDARLAKEGEVTILRKGLEKKNQEYSAEIARLRAAKEQAEATQAQAQKNMREEVERLKGQLQLKRNEEATLRRPPSSGRSQRIRDQPPPTPVRMPSQMREWNSDAGRAPRTPSRTRQITSNGSPESSRSRKYTSDHPKKSALFPGFVNAFDYSPPRASQNVQAKGKQREESKVRRDLSDSDPYPSQRQQYSSPPSSPIQFLRPMEDFNPLGPDDQGTGADVEMTDEVKDQIPVEEYDVVEPPDRRAELQRIIFSHKLSSSEPLTFHFLLGSPLPDSASAEQSRSYAALCDRLLENLGITVPKMDGGDYLNEVLSDILVQMARTLTDVRAIPALTALFSLLREVVLWQRMFARLFLSTTDDDAPPTIIALLCDVIRTCLNPPNEPMSEELSPLALRTLRLLEMLAWSAPDDLAIRLSFILKSPNVLSILLAPSQPTWLLHRSARLLAFLASHPSLFRYLLLYPETNAGEALGEKGFRHIPYIEQLSFYLTDITRQGPEADLLRESILTFVAGLVVAHPEAQGILAETETLIPSIILFLYNLTTPIYEEDEGLMNAPDLVTALCEKTNRTVSLLHTLVLGGNSTRVGLRHKLTSIKYRQFHGIMHMFNVALGRLSYADVPQWFEPSQHHALEEVMDLARQLLELNSDGPELELIWAAFQSDEEMQDMAVDKQEEDNDEESEARMLHPPDAEE
ncbi:hypothetical protein BKA93DRAFT_765040 [Sparassis latifolia]